MSTEIAKVFTNKCEHFSYYFALFLFFICMYASKADATSQQPIHLDDSLFFKNTDVKEKNNDNVIKSLNILNQQKNKNENILKISIQGIENKPYLLLMDFSPDLSDKTKSDDRNKNLFIEGFPIVKRIDSDGTYILKMRTSDLMSLNWFGKDKARCNTWRLKAYLTTKCHIQIIPEEGVKSLGKVIIFKPKDISKDFNIISLKNKDLSEYFLPSRMKYIKNSKGGFYTWISEIVAQGSIIIENYNQSFTH